MIGVVALALALGAGRTSEAPNQQGALAIIASAPLGRVAVGVIAAGLLAYAIWKLVQGFHGRGPEGGGGPKLRDRVANTAGGIVYLVFFGVAMRVLLGSSSSGSSAPRQAAAGVLGWPGGRVMVGVAGVGLVAISFYQAFDALSTRFTDDSKVESMSDRELRTYLVLGIVGLSARALVFAIVGYFLGRTAVDFSPGSAVGVDGVLSRVYQEPYGPTLLGLVAAGLIVFALYSLLEARYRRL